MRSGSDLLTTVSVYVTIFVKRFMFALQKALAASILVSDLKDILVRLVFLWC